MKKNEQNVGGIDLARVALLLGLSIGLGIVVHEGFFLVAGAIAVGSLPRPLRTRSTIMPRGAG